MFKVNLSPKKQGKNAPESKIIYEDAFKKKVAARSEIIAIC